MWRLLHGRLQSVQHSGGRVRQRVYSTCGMANASSSRGPSAGAGLEATLANRTAGYLLAPTGSASSLTASLLVQLGASYWPAACGVGGAAALKTHGAFFLLARTLAWEPVRLYCNRHVPCNLFAPTNLQ